MDANACPEHDPGTASFAIPSRQSLLRDWGGKRSTGLTKKVIKVKIRVKTSATIAGTTLKPGNYTVKVTPASSGSCRATLQFSDVVHTPYHPYVEGSGLSHEEVVLTLRVSAQDLGVPAASTELIFPSTRSNKVRGLKIRGNSTEYVFDDACGFR